MSLLLLEAPPNDVAASRAVWTCLAGEIALGPAPTLAPLWQACGLSGVSECLAHGSGLSVHGQMAVPWEQSQGLGGWYMLSVDLPAPPQGSDTFRLAPEPDRMNAAEMRGFRSVWNRLSRAINPRHPRNGLPTAATASPTWVTFELTDPTAVPNLYWKLGSGAAPSIHTGPGEVAILLADQPPYSSGGRGQPASRAQIVPQDVAIVATKTGLHISVRAGTKTEGRPALKFAWHRADPATHVLEAEHFEAIELLVAFDPVQTPALVRSLNGEPPPVLRSADDQSRAARLDPPLAWGFMPLEDGWAQLPIPNLTEQVYVELMRAEGAAAQARAPHATASILRGAVSFGNDDPEVLAGFPDEQPWSLALAGAQGVEGDWILEPDADGVVGLASVRLTLCDPVVYLNGLVWLASTAPSNEDALPDLSADARG